ncbi:MULTISPECIES: PTS sugar transporter subunit IIA [Rhizobium]|uniref:PTS sugar transporter subunit IIA n=1 Tax=Rhizobium TaxID=379 RepID=UPI00195D689D|nr:MULTISPECIES: PTS sugar transporter subunit IIA [Rhizobium]MBM7045921.1 PTS sugar transporter subunit IIA [Rhizobium lusitanum]
MALSTIILPEHVFIGMSAPTKWRALQMLSSKAASCFGLDEGTVLRALETRERLGTTGIGNGVAVPHAAIAGMTRPRGLLVRFSHPVDFEAIDDIPTEWAFVLLFGEGARSDYLNVLSAIARRLRTEGVLTAMRQAKSADELYSVFMSDSVA